MTNPDARRRIRDERLRVGRRTAVLDDDPTGSQSVHGVEVVTSLDPLEYERALAGAGDTAFILTNTRSLDETESVALTTLAAEALFELEQRIGAPIDIVSRGDSTLRGHVLAEVRAIDAASRRVRGRGYDGVLFAPAYLEAGRFTVDDTHWATVAGSPVPVGDTEFSQDATFGYSTSNLREFLAEKGGGVPARDVVLSISLDDIRVGGVARVTEILASARDLQFVVVNATDYSDLDVVVLALQSQQDIGREFVFRTGPSFVRALAGIEPHKPLTATEIWTEGPTAGKGLIVVGSHVGQSAAQLSKLTARGDLNHVEIHVETLLDPARGPQHISDVCTRVAAYLARSDVVLSTSRKRVTGSTPAKSLEIARLVSDALVTVVHAALDARPAWVIAKGGITSHDIAVRALGIRRAAVVGQLFPGMVSVLRPIEAPDETRALVYVVFAGNVGGDDALSDIVSRFQYRT